MVKFPLSYDPFPGFELSPGKRAEVERYADSIVRENIDEYMSFIHHQKRVLDRRHWKEVKSKDNMTVYKQRVSSDLAMSPEWTMPKLLAIGTIAGSLDDVMYGVTVPDMETQRICSSYVDDEIVDSRVLCQIRSATDADPYRFLGIKWLAKGHDPVVGMVIRPRDLILIDSMGICKTSNGESIGYHLVHSAELPQCPELVHLNIVRSKLSACYLFKEVEPKKKVEVYISMLVATGGNVPDSIAVLSTSNIFIQASRYAACAQLKKLAWLTAEATHQRRINPESDASHAASAQNASCACCDKSLGSSFRSPMACALCRRLACSNCRTAKRLSFLSGPNRSLVKEDTVFCVDCLVRAKRVSSRDIARYEHVPGALAQREFQSLEVGGRSQREGQRRFRKAPTSGSTSSHSSEGREATVESFEAWVVQQRLELENSSSSASR